MDCMPNFSKQAWKVLSTEKTNVSSIAKILKKYKLKVVTEDELKETVQSPPPSNLSESKIYQELADPKYDAELIKSASPNLVKLVDTVVKVLQHTSLPNEEVTLEQLENLRENATKDMEACMKGIIAAHEEFLKFVEWETAPLTKKQNICSRIDDLQKQVDAYQQTSKSVYEDNNQLKQEIAELSKFIKEFEKDQEETREMIDRYITFVENVSGLLGVPAINGRVLSPEHYDNVLGRIKQLQSSWQEDLEELDAFKEYITELIWLGVGSSKKRKSKGVLKNLPIVPITGRDSGLETKRVGLGQLKCERCEESLETFPNVGLYWKHQEKEHQLTLSARITEFLKKNVETDDKPVEDLQREHELSEGSARTRGSFKKTVTADDKPVEEVQESEQVEVLN